MGVSKTYKRRNSYKLKDLTLKALMRFFADNF